MISLKQSVSPAVDQNLRDLPDYARDFLYEEQYCIVEIFEKFPELNRTGQQAYPNRE